MHWKRRHILWLRRNTNNKQTTTLIPSSNITQQSLGNKWFSAGYVKYQYTDEIPEFDKPTTLSNDKKRQRQVTQRFTFDK